MGPWLVVCVASTGITEVKKSDNWETPRWPSEEATGETDTKIVSQNVSVMGENC